MMEAPQVQRHRTAMVRHSLSQPMSLAVRHGLIRDSVDVFDYGCGQGDDLRALAAAGVTATGWDPHFAADASVQEADVVNLGFVLNVIEDPSERREALDRAWGIAGRVLLVSVMLVGAVPTGGLRPFGDGYLTSRGTFQKFYQHAEVRAYVAQVTGVEPVALAPGIFAAFRSPEDEQDFLFERQRGRRISTAAYKSERLHRARPRAPDLPERIPTTIEAVASFALDRGRMPHPDELAADVHHELASERVSFARALEACRATALDEAELATAAERRREDLLVHHALGILNRTRSSSRPSSAMVRDMRALFGSQREMAEQALEYLHALADPQRTIAAMERSAAEGLGILDEDGRLVVSGDGVEALSGTLRCYIGCGVHFVGELDDVHLVRLDPIRKRLALFPLSKPRSTFPVVERSFTVDLKRQDVALRDERRLLVRKADVFAMSARSKQRQAEKALRDELGLEPKKVLARR